MNVLDASAALELVLGTGNGEVVVDRIADPAVSIHAPHLLSIEVAQVMRRLVGAGEVTAPRRPARSTTWPTSTSSGTRTSRSCRGSSRSGPT